MIAPLNTAFSLSFTLAMSEAAVTASLLDPSGETTRKLARLWGREMCRVCGVQVTVSGGQAVAWDEPLIVMANHQSYFDIPVLYATLPHPFGMLAKQELFRVPVFSAAMRGMRCVPIDRGNRRQSFESLKRAADQVRGGNSIVVFPEGTRSSDGRVQELKKGPFYLAEMAEVPVVPVGIFGTRGALAKNGLLVRGAKVKVSIGGPLVQENKGQPARDRLRDAVRSALVELSGQRSAEAVPIVA
jgi:1-acyl-sn-glycerol-3-phosphate acyltransferase